MAEGVGAVLGHPEAIREHTGAHNVALLVNGANLWDLASREMEFLSDIGSE